MLKNRGQNSTMLEKRGGQYSTSDPIGWKRGVKRAEPTRYPKYSEYPPPPPPPPPGGPTVFTRGPLVQPTGNYSRGALKSLWNRCIVLCVCIDEQLSINAHVDHICTKAGRQVSALQRLTGVLDYESRLAIYKSFIMSNFVRINRPTRHVFLHNSPWWHIYASVNWVSIADPIHWRIYVAPSHYLNQCWLIVNWTHMSKLQWNFNQNTKLFIHKNAS